MTDFLSVVVVSYESARELPRTLHSLSPRFQEGISADDYEVIVVDNGSRRPPTVDQFADLGLDLTVLCVDDPSPSPVRAVNHGLNASCGAAIGVFIDGARLASPGLLRRTREALSLHPRAVVGARGRYLGPMMQRRAMAYGYDQDVEDALLDTIDWKANGYELFAISVFDETSRPLWHGQVGETNALFMRRALWRELGGYDPAFESPGGGFVNLDSWDRACHLPDVSPILLLGEATFHQFHGGVATNTPRTADIDVFRDEYIAIRGRDHVQPAVPVSFWGSFHHQPRPDELVLARVRPAERMKTGPMKGLLDLSKPVVDLDADVAAAASSLMPSPETPVVAAPAQISRPRRVVRAAVRRLPAKPQAAVRGLIRRRGALRRSLTARLRRRS